MLEQLDVSVINLSNCKLDTLVMVRMQGKLVGKSSL